MDTFIYFLVGTYGFVGALIVTRLSISVRALEDKVRRMSIAVGDRTSMKNRLEPPPGTSQSTETGDGCHS